MPNRSRRSGEKLTPNRGKFRKAETRIRRRWNDKRVMRVELKEHYELTVRGS